MSHIASPAEYEAYRCPDCSGPSRCALGMRAKLMCRCDAHGPEPRFWLICGSCKSAGECTEECSYVLHTWLAKQAHERGKALAFVLWRDGRREEVSVPEARAWDDIEVSGTKFTLAMAGSDGLLYREVLP